MTTGPTRGKRSLVNYKVPNGLDVVPRYGTPRRPERPTRGHILGMVAGLLGWSLFPWQRYTGDVSLEYDPISKLPQYRTVGLSVSRQNGKTTLVLVRIAAQLIVPRSTVAYTAQDRNIARFKWAEYVDVLLDTPFADRVEHVSRNNGSEGLHMTNGSQFVIVTPGEKAGRSMSIDLGIIDEAAQHKDLKLVGALNPTMIARPQAQLWLLSNAGTFDSVLWRHYTDLGRGEVDNPLSSLCWLEWSADEDADVLDRVAWREANPSLDLPGGPSSVALADAALSLPADVFRREHLNVWSDIAQMTGIDAVTWSACRDDDLVVGSKLALGIDFTPERDRGALVAVGDVDGRTPIEVVEHTSDLERLVSRTVEVATSTGATVIVDRGSPAASILPALERADVAVRLISLPDFVRACGDFHDAAITGRLAHRGDYRLHDAVAGASKRKVGDSWSWKRRGGADISPLVAATLARWGVVAAVEHLVPVIF